MYKVILSPKALADAGRLKQSEPKAYQKLVGFIEELKEHPKTGTGHPEPLMKQLAKYLKRLVAKKQDETLMTKEEFFAKLDEAEREIAEGKGIVMLPNETLDDLLRRVG